MIWVWLVLAAAIGAVVAAGLLHAAAERDRRGGLLELDTRAARDALTLATEARSVEVYGRRRRVVRRWEDGSVTTLLACGHVAINDCPVVSFHGLEFCSFECVNASIARPSGIRPFAGGDAA